MDIEQIINEIEAKIDGCRTIPFWGRGIIDKEEILDMIQEMRNKFPEELKQAKWVKEERQRIISDAQKEAAAMFKSTEEKIVAMVNEHDITQQAYMKASQIEENTRQSTNKLMQDADQYADSVLRALEEDLLKTADFVHSHRKINK